MLGEHPMTSHSGLSRRQLLRRTAGGGAVLAAAAACGAPASSAADAATTADPNGPATLGLGIVGLIVQDLQLSLAFYRTLGLDIPANADGDNFRMQLPTGQTFFWDTDDATRNYDPAWQPSTGSRRVVLEFGFGTAEAVDAKYTELIDAGYESYLAVGDLYGARYALVVDPDGNQIGLRYPLAS